MISDRTPATQTIWVLGIVWTVHLLVNLLWLVGDTYNAIAVPDGWIHALGVSRVATALRLDGLGAGVATALDRNSHYPMLAHLPSGLAGALWGQSHTVLRAANAVYLLLLLWGMVRLGRQLHSLSAGLLAAALVSLMPAVYGGSRTLGLDFPLLCVTPLAVDCLLRSRGFADLRWSAAFGLTAGLATLVKGQALLFLFWPALGVLAQGIVAARRDQARAGLLPTVRGAAAALLLLGMISAGWWGRHATYLLDQWNKHVSGQGMIHYEGDISLWGGVVHYLATFPLLVTGPLCVGLLLGLPAFWRHSRHRWPVLLWLVLPTMVHMVLKVRHHRYLFPLVPAVALVLAVAICSRQPRLRARLAGATAVVLLALWLICSTTPMSRSKTPLGPLDRALSSLRRSSRPQDASLLACGDTCYAHAPATTWPVRPYHDMAENVVRQLSGPSRENHRVLLHYRLDLLKPEFIQAVLLVQDRLPQITLRCLSTETVTRPRFPDGWQVYQMQQRGTPSPANAVALFRGHDVELWQLAGPSKGE